MISNEKNKQTQGKAEFFIVQPALPTDEGETGSSSFLQVCFIATVVSFSFELQLDVNLTLHANSMLAGILYFSLSFYSAGKEIPGKAQYSRITETISLKCIYQLFSHIKIMENYNFILELFKINFSTFYFNSTPLLFWGIISSAMPQCGWANKQVSPLYPPLKGSLRNQTNSVVP